MKYSYYLGYYKFADLSKKNNGKVAKFKNLFRRKGNAEWRVLDIK